MVNIMRKEQKWKTRKAWIWNGSIVAALAAAIAVFTVMLQTEKNMLTQYERDIIYVVNKEIPKGLVLTEKNFAEYVSQRELDKGLIPESALNDPKQIVGLAALYGIEQGTFLTRGMFESVNQITAHMSQPVIAGFKAEDIYQVVGGTLRAGDRIHIYHVDEQGQAYLSWSDVYVQQVFDASGQSISGEDDTSTAQRVNVYLDKENVEQFYTELASGNLRVVKGE